MDLNLILSLGGSYSYELFQQHWWKELIALYLFLGGMGGTAMCIAFYYWMKGRDLRIPATIGLVGVISVIIGTVSLLSLIHI